MNCRLRSPFFPGEHAVKSTETAARERSVGGEENALHSPPALRSFQKQEGVHVQGIAKELA